MALNAILIDTNAYAALLHGDRRVLDALAGAERIYLSVFVLGELHAGFHRGSKRRENLDRLAHFLQQTGVRILNANADTAEILGQLKAGLKQAGTPIPLNDVWVAAHAIETGSVLVTYDAHFRHIAGLRLWDHL